MPRFVPFRGLHYPTAGSTEITPLTSPPYDVFDETERARLSRLSDHNIVRVDYPVEPDGPGRYDRAGETFRQWIETGVLIRDDADGFYVYRMSFTDSYGRSRNSIGVIGGLEVVDEGSGEVLAHERTTPKAKTDRLDLTRATRANLSPVWGLSLAAGLTALLRESGDEVARCTDEQGVEHVLERVTDRRRLEAIRRVVESRPVLIADGHHRYAISRTYRDEARATGGPRDAEYTMTFVQELVEEQLNIAAIHRLLPTPHRQVMDQILGHYEPCGSGNAGPTTLATMRDLGSLCLLDDSGGATFLRPRTGAFDGVRDMDSVRLEIALGPLATDLSYQHGLDEVREALRAGMARTAILIRPVGLSEIRHTADTGDLMPPKSTFFTPKLRTGLIMRPMD